MKEKQSSPHGKQLRVGRASLPHQAYLVTVLTKSRADIFTRHEPAAIAARCFYDATIARHADTLAFVVMPDHIHWLMQLGEASSLSEAARI